MEDIKRMTHNTLFILIVCILVQACNSGEPNKSRLIGVNLELYDLDETQGVYDIIEFNTLDSNVYSLLKINLEHDYIYIGSSYCPYKGCDGPEDKINEIRFIVDETQEVDSIIKSEIVKVNSNSLIQGKVLLVDESGYLKVDRFDDLDEIKTVYNNREEWDWSKDIYMVLRKEDLNRIGGKGGLFVETTDTTIKSNNLW